MGARSPGAPARGEGEGARPCFARAPFPAPSSRVPARGLGRWAVDLVGKGSTLSPRPPVRSSPLAPPPCGAANSGPPDRGPRSVFCAQNPCCGGALRCGRRFGASAFGPERRGRRRTWRTSGAAWEGKGKGERGNSGALLLLVRLNPAWEGGEQKDVWAHGKVWLPCGVLEFQWLPH